MAKKKVTKKKAAKPAKKKVVKKAAKKGGKKAAPKKVAKKKPVKKKSPAKKNKPVKKSAKKSPKKVSNKKKVVKKVLAKKAKPSKKAVAKKNKPAAKPAPKKQVKKVVKKVVKATKPAVKTVKKVSKPKAVKTVKLSKPMVIDTTPVIETPTVVETVKAETVAEPKAFVPHSTSLHEGTVAPYFEGFDQYGNFIRSTDYMGKTLVLYFYPKDFTDGCTAQACSLRESYQYFQNNDHVVVGVSADDIDSHKRFSDEHTLPFPLIADTNKSIIYAFDVWGQKQLAGNVYDGIVRTTFIIDPDGIIKHIIKDVNTADHAEQIRNL